MSWHPLRDLPEDALERFNQVMAERGTAPSQRAPLPRAPYGRSGHGTSARYRKHLRDGEPACQACLEAHREYRQGLRAQARDARMAPSPRRKKAVA
jgi:hypothetical protein